MSYKAPAAFSDKAYKHIPMTPVTSGQIKAIGHDSASNTLAVTFTRGPGTIYHYQNVSADQHAAFMGAESKGTFFGQNIKALPFDKFSADKGAEATV